MAGRGTRPEYADVVNKAPSSRHQRFAAWLEENTGYAPDIDTVKLTMSLVNTWRQSDDAAQFRAEADQARAAEADARVQRRAERAQTRAERLREQLAKVEDELGSIGGVPAPAAKAPAKKAAAKAAAKAAPAKKAPAKAAAKKAPTKAAASRARREATVTQLPAPVSVPDEGDDVF